MSKKNEIKKSKKIEIIEENSFSDSGSGSDSGSSSGEEVLIMPKKIKLEKSKKKPIENIIETKKERKPYVMTEARKQAFDKAKQIRDENIKLNKTLKEKEEQIIKELKDKAKNKKIKKISKLETQINNISDSDFDEEVIIKKKKKPKKKRVVYVDESDDEERNDNKKNVIIINNGKEAESNKKATIPRRNYNSYFV
jgi:hypothetical protein